MTVDLDRAPGGTRTVRGQELPFCSKSCSKKFDADPEKYLGAKKPEPISAPPGAEWTCPMHPEIVRSEPGACPICGMALEPRTVTLGGENPELADMSRRFWTSLLFTVPAFVLGMSDFVPGMPVQRALGRWLPVIELVLATPVVLWAGWPLFER